MEFLGPRAPGFLTASKSASASSPNSSSARISSALRLPSPTTPSRSARPKCSRRCRAARPRRALRPPLSRAPRSSPTARCTRPRGAGRSTTARGCWAPWAPGSCPDRRSRAGRTAGRCRLARGAVAAPARKTPVDRTAGAEVIASLSCNIASFIGAHGASAPRVWFGGLAQRRPGQGETIGATHTSTTPCRIRLRRDDQRRPGGGLRGNGERLRPPGLAAPPDHAVRRIVGLSLLVAVRHLAPDVKPASHARVVDAYRASKTDERSRLQKKK